jgi:multiple sugar transport system permease protein
VSFQSSHYSQVSVLMAGTVTSQIPVLVMFVLAQRFFVRSIASSGIK